MLLEMKGKVKFLMKLLKKMKENQPKIKIVVLQLLDRNDGKTKQKISKMVGEGEVKGARGQTWKKLSKGALGPFYPHSYIFSSLFSKGTIIGLIQGTPSLTSVYQRALGPNNT